MMKKIDLEKIKQEKSIKELLEFSILNIDKPVGHTSFWVSDFIRKQLGARKTSHLGTLDPKVSGVLPIALNRACRLSTWMMRKDKTYVGIMRLHSKLKEEKLREEMKRFTGKIRQLPPVRSRVRREERERQVKRFEILEWEKDNKENSKGKDVLFLAEVEAGTYLRKLISDLGEKIGGAHMLELRRLKAGIFSETSSINLYDFNKAVEQFKEGNENFLKDILIPGEIIGEIMPVVQVKEKAIKRLYTGSPVFRKFLNLETRRRFKQGEFIAVFSGNRFIEIARVVVLSLPGRGGVCRVDERGERGNGLVCTVGGVGRGGEIFARPEFVLN